MTFYLKILTLHLNFFDLMWAIKISMKQSFHFLFFFTGQKWASIALVDNFILYFCFPVSSLAVATECNHHEMAVWSV